MSLYKTPHEKLLLEWKIREKLISFDHRDCVLYREACSPSSPHTFVLASKKLKDRFNCHSHNHISPLGHTWVFLLFVVLIFNLFSNNF